VRRNVIKKCAAFTSEDRCMFLVAGYENVRERKLQMSKRVNRPVLQGKIIIMLRPYEKHLWIRALLLLFRK